MLECVSFCIVVVAEGVEEVRNCVDGRLIFFRFFGVEVAKTCGVGTESVVEGLSVGNRYGSHRGKSAAFGFGVGGIE